MSRPFSSWRFLCLLSAMIAGYCANQASAAVLFNDTFDNAGSSADWTVNKTGDATRQDATFGWDYSELGIPAAPGNAADDTFGLRLRANVSANTTTLNDARVAGTTGAGLSLSPTGEDFGTNYRMTFYVWANYFGNVGPTVGTTVNTGAGLGNTPASAGGTFNVLAAVGTAGTTPQTVGSTAAATGTTIDSVAFVTTNDGGATDDVRVFVKSNTAATRASGVYAADPSGTSTTTGEVAGNVLNNLNPFYVTALPSLGDAELGTIGDPTSLRAIQQAEADLRSPDNSENVMMGSTSPGTFGLAWHKVEVVKNEELVQWRINDELFSTVDVSAIPLGGNNVAIGHTDFNNTSARFPWLAFTVFDNLTVESIEVIPEPTTISLAIVSLGMMGLCSRRRRVA